MDKFLKCDMHLHSSSCYSRNYNESSFIKTMKDSDLDVFSITDHNVIDVELYKKLSTMITDKDIIGGVELNIAIDCEEIEKRKLTVDRKSTRLNSSHVRISYAVFCLKKKKKNINR